MSSSRRVIVNSTASGSLNDRFTQMKKVGLSPQKRTTRGGSSGGSTTVTFNGNSDRGSHSPRGGQVSRGGRGGSFTSSRGGRGGSSFNSSRGGRGGSRGGFSARGRGGRGGSRGGRGGRSTREKTPTKEELDAELDQISETNSVSMQS